MSLFSNPFDANSRLACGCGRHASQAEHERAVQSVTDNAVDQAVMRALFPEDGLRRRFLRAVGGGTAMAAIASIFPLAAAREAFAQSTGPLEKQKLKVGFIPITCATPIIMAHPMGFYAKQGLDVEVVKTAGWALVRDKAMSGEYDAAHMLSPMPLAISLGVGASRAVPWTMPAVENINGQA
ncbi:MAG: ABC transporter substrate-binding protein, partial [Achromobacter spanius]